MPFGNMARCQHCHTMIQTDVLPADCGCKRIKELLENAHKLAGEPKDNQVIQCALCGTHVYGLAPHTPEVCNAMKKFREQMDEIRENILQGRKEQVIQRAIDANNDPIVIDESKKDGR